MARKMLREEQRIKRHFKEVAPISQQAGPRVVKAAPVTVKMVTPVVKQAPQPQPQVQAQAPAIAPTSVPAQTKAQTQAQPVKSNTQTVQAPKPAAPAQTKQPLQVTASTPQPQTQLKPTTQIKPQPTLVQPKPTQPPTQNKPAPKVPTAAEEAAAREAVIKSSKSAPSVPRPGAAPRQKCSLCGETAYPMESLTCSSEWYHKACFK